MPTNYLDLPLGPEFPEVVNAVIEVPAGQANKYEYDPALKVFRLDRPLYASVHYPGDYGFIPGTCSTDGDPLDILILLPHPTFAGCLVRARPVGVLAMLDQGIRDEKVLAVAANSPLHKSVRHHTDLEPQVLREIEHFFSIYKELEGKRTKAQGWHDAGHARELIRSSRQRFAARRHRPRKRVRRHGGP